MRDRPDTPRKPERAPSAVLGLIVVLAGTIAAPLDSAVNIAFPGIAANFGREVQDISWIAITYVLTYTSLLLIFGKLGDLIGYRIVFQFGLAASAAGLAGCAFATSFESLLLARVLQGIGIALVLSCAPALAISLFDEQQRTRVLGSYAGMFAVGTAVGPMLGGVLIDVHGWDVVFWARVPLVLAALALSWTIPATKGQGTVSDLDPLGSVQLVTALCAIVLGLVASSAAFGPLPPVVVVGFGAVMLALFLRRQARRVNPIIRLAPFRDPVFALINAASFVASFSAFSVVLIGPFYLIQVARLDASVAGLVLAIGGGGALVGSWLAPRVVGRMGRVRTSMLGMVMLAVGLAGIATWAADDGIAVMAWPLFVQGVGLGLFQVAYTDLVTATLPVSERGVAGSLTTITRTLGIIAGAAVHGALHRWLEMVAIPTDASAAFMAGFRGVFMLAAAVQVLALMIAAVVVWRSRLPVK